jgi:hypothetical protein
LLAHIQLLELPSTENRQRSAIYEAMRRRQGTHVDDEAIGGYS